MIGLGIFILLVVGLASLAVVFGGGQSVHIDMPWFTINTSVSVVFLSGAVGCCRAAAWQRRVPRRRRHRTRQRGRHRWLSGRW